jgi:hypothetical protein
MSKKLTIISSSGIAIVSILSVQLAIAQSLDRITRSIDYVPKTPEAESPRKTQASTSRGCSQNLAELIELFAPQTHVGLTVSSRPTLLFKLKEKSPVPAKIVIAAVDGRSAIVEQPLSLTTPGVKSVSLPPGVELKPNQKYVWSIVLICNRVRPSANTVVQAFIERIDPTLKLAQQLKKTTSRDNKAKLYAENGIWYDAIALLQNDRRLLQELFAQREGARNKEKLK